MFKIFATFTKSFDNKNNNLHLIASTVALFEPLDLNTLSRAFGNDVRNKKTLVIEVSELYNKDVIEIDNDYLHKHETSWNEIRDTMEEYGVGSRIETETLSYLKLDLHYLITMLYSNEALNVVLDLFHINFEEKGKPENLYNQILFIFDNITWSNIVLKFKLNNIEISGGSTTNRHILTTSDILLNYYLNLIFEHDIEKIMSVGYHSYKLSKEILSSQIPLDLYRKLLQNNVEILNTDPKLLYEKILSMNKINNENTKLDDRTLGTKEYNKEIKIIVSNILLTRKTIIKTMSLHRENILVTRIENKIKQKSNYLGSLKVKYDTSLPLVTSRKQRKIVLKELKKELLNVNLNSHYDEINKIELELKLLNQELDKNKEELMKYIEDLKKLSFIELFRKYEDIRNSIKYDNYSINSPNKLFQKYKKASLQKPRSLNLSPVRTYCTSIQPINQSNRLEIFIDNSSKNQDKNIDSVKQFEEIKTSEKNSHSLQNLIKNNKNRFFFYNRIEKIFLNITSVEKSQIELENLLTLKKSEELESEEFRFNVIEDLNILNIDIKNFILERKEKIFKLLDNLRDNGRLRNFDINNIPENANKNEITLVYLSNIIENVDNLSIFNILMYVLFNIINNYNTVDIYLNTHTQIINLIIKKLYRLYLYNLYIKELKDKKKLEEFKFFNKDEIEITDQSELEDIHYFNWKNNKKILIYKLSEPDLQHSIGSKLVELLYDTNCVKLNKKVIEENEQYYYEPTETLLNLLPKDGLGNFINPLIYSEKLPMIAKPKNYERVNFYREDGTKYTIEKLGGYFLNNLFNNDEIIINNWRLKFESKIKDFNMIYDTINKMSSVGFKINKNVLNFIIEFNEVYDLTLIDKIHPLEVKQKKDKLTKKESKELESFISQKRVQDNIIALAYVYSLVDEFFIPVRLDYRGRIYCTPAYLNYQSTELAKSLLLFSKSEQIIKTDTKSINYLKIYGANCFGNGLDKKSGNDRIKWIDDNIHDIIHFWNGKLIKKADSKLLFIAFCFEFKKFIEEFNNDKPFFKTYLPIQLDATCNGYQHISMLGNDKILSENLNIKTSNFENVPDDFYSIIGLMVKEMISKEIEKSEYNDKLESYLRLNKISLHRNILKKCIMTIPYNVSRLQAIKYLKEGFDFDEVETNKRNKIKNNFIDANRIIEENGLYFDNVSPYNLDSVDNMEVVEIERAKNKKIKTKKINQDSKLEIWWKYKTNSEIKLESKDFNIIYDFLIDIITKIAPSLLEISSYLKQIANICSAANIYIPWTLPTGIEVRQSYMEIKNYRISPFNYAKYSFNLKIINSEKIDNRKQIAAFMPNLIHSLDAASLVILLHGYFNNNNLDVKNIFAIHDCFAVTANNMNYVINSLKASYMLLYSDKKYIIELDNNIKKHIKTFIDEDFDNSNNIDNFVKVTVFDKNVKKIKKFKYPDINKILNTNYDISVNIKNSSYLIN
jgi:hypothetical protein